MLCKSFLFDLFLKFQRIPYIYYILNFMEGRSSCILLVLFLCFIASNFQTNLFKSAILLLLVLSHYFNLPYCVFFILQNILSLLCVKNFWDTWSVRLQGFSKLKLSFWRYNGKKYMKQFRWGCNLFLYKEMIRFYVHYLSLLYSFLLGCQVVHFQNNSFQCMLENFLISNYLLINHNL